MRQMQREVQVYGRNDIAKLMLSAESGGTRFESGSVFLSSGYNLLSSFDNIEL